MQFERVADHPKTMVPWVTAKLSQLGEQDRLSEFSDWVESCLSKPWEHTETNSRGAVYDGCYAGKNGDIQETHKFMAWFLPYHASGGKNDTCFPDWALEKLRQGGHALTQRGNGTGTANSTSDGDVYVACLRELEGSAHGAANLSATCRAFVQRLQTDDESGRAEVEEREFVHEEGMGEEDPEAPHGEDEVAESLEDLPGWLQKKFEAALSGRAAANDVSQD